MARKLVNLTCVTCNKAFEVYSFRKTCSKECLKKLQIKMFSGKNNPAYGKVYRTKETHPEWAAKVSKTAKERKINSGDKNGMKQD